MIRAVIFDCFGVVLSDSLQVLIDELATKNIAAAQEAKELVRAVNKGILEPSQTRPMIADLLGLSLAEYTKVLRSGEVKNLQLMHYIRSLRPEFKTGMLSNVGIGSLQKRFDAGELDAHFDTVVASGEIGFAKPEREAYLIVAERLGVLPEECVFTDDRESFCDGATSVGMQSILYTEFAQFTKELAATFSRENP